MTGPSETIREEIAGGRLTIDLDALAANWRDLSERSGEAVTAAVIKGDGYGVGLEQAATALAGAGCDTFFVALPDEGLRLRQARPDATVYVLDGFFDQAAEVYFEADLRPVLSSPTEIEAWTEARRDRAGPGAALHVDTGMNRLGLRVEEARQLAADRDRVAGLGLSLLISHLACADTPDHPLNAQQLAAFRDVRALFPGLPVSLANSPGIFLGPDYHFELVRPGVALFGGRAVADGANPMRPVVTLEGRILQIRDANSQQTVGYGATETLGRPSRLAILGVGYADGYPRHASSSDRQRGAFTFVRGRLAPLVGRVSMDLIAVDVTDIPGVTCGEWVELFGPNIAIDDVAEDAGTIGYQLLTGLGHRFHRRYVSSI